MNLLMFLRHSLQQLAGGFVGRAQHEAFPQRVLRLRRLTQAIKRLSQIVEGIRLSGVESDSLIQMSDGGPALAGIIIEDAQKEIASGRSGATLR
jgi:transposase